MSILTANHLAKSYGLQDVFSEVSLDVPHGAKIALVGSNGSGKTTLLRILADLETPSAGEVHRAKRLQVAYLPQQADPVFGEQSTTLREEMEDVFVDLREKAAALRRLEAEMADPETREKALERYGAVQEAFEFAGGYAYEHRIDQVLAGLGFDEETFHQPVNQLSGGQKTRALLARLLLEDPDLLLLDEPTNHLDLAGIEWLEGYLKAWKGALIVVAHDRDFLDAIVDRVWEIEWESLSRYRGNYSDYTVQKAERLARQQTEYERQQAFIQRTEDFIRRNIAGQRTREAQGRQKRLERLERVEHYQERQTMGLSLGKAARTGDLVLGMYNLTLGYDPDDPLFTIDELELRRGDRVALLGPNGSGKTTLIRTILAEIPPLDGEFRIGANVQFGYFAQGHAGLDPEKSVLDTIIDAGEPMIGRARNLLGRYQFSGDDVFKLVGALSGGEQARVALAVLAQEGANVLILDEPTNHLDIPSQEVLQGVLSKFDGSMLIVTHDRYLVRQLATEVWAIERDALQVFDDYAAYRAWVAQRRQQTTSLSDAELEAEREKERRAREAAERAEAARLAARRACRMAEIEEIIRSLEARKAQLETQLAAASERREIDRVRQLGNEYAGIETELENLLSTWVEVG